MKRVKYTEEERKEAKRIKNAKYYAENKEAIKKHKAKYYAKNNEDKKEYQAKYDAENKKAKKEYNAKYKAKNKETIKEYHAKYRASLITHFVVYAHTNSKGDVYIGCGDNLRPYKFKGNNRSKDWHKAFDNECEIKILGEFKNKKQALTKEKELINAFGLNNLVNVRA